MSFSRQNGNLFIYETRFVIWRREEEYIYMRNKLDHTHIHINGISKLDFLEGKLSCGDNDSTSIFD
jgi:hypothetical protein